MVEYFGENPKTTSPSMFFSLFSRFTKAYKVQGSDGWGSGLCSLCLRAVGTGEMGKVEGCPHQDLPWALRKQNRRWNSGRRKQLQTPQAGKSLQHPRWVAGLGPGTGTGIYSILFTPSQG